MVFEKPQGLLPSKSYDHHILLFKGTAPVNIRPYQYPFYHKSEIEKMVQEMLKTGITYSSRNPFFSPVLMVRKADGGWCMYVDYRALHNISVKDRFPIPEIDEFLDELHGTRIFSKIDLYSRYHQIRVVDSDIPKTAFCTHDGHYKFLVMPFGLYKASYSGVL